MVVHGRAACALSTSLIPFQPQIISLVSKQSSVHQTDEQSAHHNHRDLPASYQQGTKLK